LQEEGLNCTGVGFDISQEALNKARSLFPDLEFERASVFEIERTFDIVLVVDVLEHLESPVAFLHRCLSLARVIVIHLPLDENLWGKLLHGKSYYEYLRGDRGHVKFFDKTRGFRLIRAAGGDLLAWKYTPWGLEHDFDHSRTGMMVRILRRISFHISMDLGVRVFGGASLAAVCAPPQRSPLRHVLQKRREEQGVQSSQVDLLPL
jgi:hypothetical protein